MKVYGRIFPQLRRMGLSLRFAILASLLASSAVFLAQPPLAADVTERVSVATDGTQGNGDSWTNAISADGRFVVFYSGATDLVSGDTNGVKDVFVHDRQTGETERVSVASDGTQGDGETWHGAISGDGRYVGIASASANLVPGDTNGKWDVFVHDRQTGQTERVSVASDGTQANEGSWHAAISADGRYVAFGCYANNLVSGDTNGQADIFVHDRQTAETKRVSVSSDGWQGNMDSSSPAISADGRYVAFESWASTLIVGDMNDTCDVFVHDRETGQTERVSLVDGGGEANNSSTYAAISADGRYVAFMSNAANLVDGDTNGNLDVFVYDRQTVETERVSVASDGTQGNGDSWHPSISADGRYVAFDSAATCLVAGDSNGQADVFLHDRHTGETTRVNLDSSGTQAAGNSDVPFISAGGRFIAFRSTAANLVAVDTNGVDDVFVRVRLTADFTASPTGGPPPLTVDFTDLSFGGATSWEWDFGDGGTSTDQHPSHEYLASGSYTVTLTVQGVGCSDSVEEPDYISVTAAPIADFSGSPTSGTAPLTVDFTDLSLNGPTSWEWDFGDGGASTAQHPSHEYTSPGSYTVFLTASNAAGSGIETKTDYITVAPAPPVADFSASPTSGPAPLEVTFTDLSANEPTSWSWDFGDGDTSTEQSPTHTYSAAGIYTVGISAANEAGYDTETKVEYITVFFPDVEPDEWACEAVLACIDAGIVSGYDDGLYHPEWAVARDQMAAYISRAVCTPMGEAGLADYTPPAIPSFTDVGTDYWAYTYIEYAAEANIVGGYDDQTYHPERVLDRAQMAVFIARALVTPGGDAGVPDPVGDPTFPDVTSDSDYAWCRKHVEYIAGEGVCGGYDDDCYHPEYVCTRDQMAVYIARAFGLGS